MSAGCLSGDLGYSTVKHLRLLGWDVIHTIDVGMERATDKSIIDYARTEGRFCVTLDSDFHSIIALANVASPSVIRIRQEGLKGIDAAELLERIYPQIDNDLSKGAFVTVTEKALRIRRLPI